MNNVTCSIVEDLLPLYMDGCCSKDSQQAVVEHMKTCEKCRETYRHLQCELPTIANETTDMRSEEIARSLSKRIKKRKAAAAVFAVIFFMFAMLSLLRRQGNHDISISVSSRLTFWEALSRALQNE